MRFWQRPLVHLLKPTLTFMSRERLPQKEGRITLDGLREPVVVTYDRWGVPAITAANRADLFFAQGFVQAQDRFWQIEIHRLVALGELAAVVGAPGLPIDRLTRTLGFTHLAQRTEAALPADIQQGYAAYAAGINRYLELTARLPVEFSLLRHPPRPWSVRDSLAMARLQGWTLTRGWSGEWVRARLRSQVDPAAWREIDPGLKPGDYPFIDDASHSLLAEALEGVLGAGLFYGSGQESGIGSNSWAVAPQHTKNGRAILVNDIHLPLSLPGYWYLTRQRCTAADQPLFAAGAVLPGSPFIIAGQNEAIAWGITLSYADCADLFVIRPGLQDSETYEFDGETRPFVERQERIAVKGSEPHVEIVRQTHHGPIVSDILYPEDQALLALRSAALDEDTALDGLARLAEAGSWEAFQAAAARIETPSLTLVYADAAGHIGRLLTGRIPIRGGGSGLTPLPGWSAKTGWQGYIPSGELPMVFNPPEGYVVACNQDVGDGRADLGRTWMSGWRADRLVELVSAKMERADGIDLEDCLAWQLDTLSLPARAFLRQIASLGVTEPLAAESLSLLQNWDGRMTVDSAGAAVFAVLLGELARLLLEPVGDDHRRATLLGHGPHSQLRPMTDWTGHWPATLLNWLRAPDSAWLPGGYGRQALLETGLTRTTLVLRSRLGARSDKWRWGALHKASFRHPLSTHPLLREIFTVGVWELPGSGDTLWQAATTADPDGDPQLVHGAAGSYRFVAEPGRTDRGGFLTVPGQSGQLASPHFADLLPLWLDGELIPLDPQRDSKSGRPVWVSRLQLQPAPPVRPVTSAD